MLKRVLKLSIVLGLPLMIASCDSKTGTETAEAVESEVSGVAETVEEVADKMEATADEATEAVEEVSDAVTFTEGSWGYGVQSFLNTEGAGEQTFKLDQLVLSDDEGDDELSDAATKQLDELAALLKANPAVNAEVQGHSREANNAVGKAAKKGWSKAKAFFVRKKLIALGVSEDQLRHEGYGDQNLITGVDGKDASQNRIEVKLAK